MKPNHLEELLKQDAPPPDPEARVAARRAALAEFARVHVTSAVEPAKPSTSFFQGLLARLRLSREPQASGSDSMRWFNNRMWMGATASVCIALVGSVVVWNTMREDPRVAEVRGSETPAQPHAASPSASSSFLQGSPDEISVHAAARTDEPVPPPELATPAAAGAGQVGPAESGRDNAQRDAGQKGALADAQ